MKYLINSTDHIALLLSKIDSTSTQVVEAKGHLDHPEDLVFLQGTNGALRAISAMENTVANPGVITIKWDGYPAILWGRDSRGRFSIMDKHMFNKKDGSGRKVYSPQEFVQYDTDRNVIRGELHEIIRSIWNDLERSTPGTGYFWGDLLFSRPLKASDGLYQFRANPRGISYTVEVNSEMGKFLRDKQAGIVVHQYMDPESQSTDDATSLNGTIGDLQNVTNVAIVPARMPLTPNIRLNKRAVTMARNVVAQNAAVVDALFANPPQAKSAFISLFTTYINSKIISGSLNNLLTDFYKFYKNRPLTASMRGKLDQYFAQHQAGISGAFAIWIALYNLKMSIVQQLDKAAEASPVKGYLENGTQTQEGFVSYGLKFVDRMGFSRQNLSSR